MRFVQRQAFPVAAVFSAVVLLPATLAPMRAAAQSREQTNTAIDRQTTGTISGTVTDRDGKPIQYGQVSIQGIGSRGAQIDSAGRFRIANVPPGNHQVEVLSIGYIGKSVPVDLKAGEHVAVSFVLEESAIALTDSDGCFPCAPVQRKIPVVAIPNIQQDSAVKLVPTRRHPVPTRADGGGREQKWCAAPRQSEPLLKEGIRLGTGNDEETKGQRAIIGIAPVAADSITIIRDEAVCRRAAEAYRNVLRASVADRFGSHADSPVLVVAVGSVYLVDDLRARGTYWEVMVFDRGWRRRYGYGGGA